MIKQISSSKFVNVTRRHIVGMNDVAHPAHVVTCRLRRRRRRVAAAAVAAAAAADDDGVQ